MSPARKAKDSDRSHQADMTRRSHKDETSPRASFISLLTSAGKQARPTDWPGAATSVNKGRFTRVIRGSGTLVVLLQALFGFALGAATLETPFLRFQLAPDTGRYELVDKQARVTWQSNPYQARFGEVTLNLNGKPRRLPLSRGEVQVAGDTLDAVFAPLAENPEAKLRVHIRVAGDRQTLEFGYEADAALKVEDIRLLDDALWVTDAAHGYAVVPTRLGLMIPADSGRSFTHRFGTYDYEGCHMAMAGMVRSGAAVMFTWTDPYTALELRSAVTNASWADGKQVLSATLALRRSARSFRLHLLGRGDYTTIARAYRQVARAQGWLVTWDQKLQGHPERAKYFGASNYKLWSMLSRSMSEDSKQEKSARVNWTFAEAAQVAEHLKQDLQLDRVLFIMGGWIRRGYDNQHPDILPTAPECGGDAAFAEACRRIRAQGYLLSLHDNYQDIYRDAPSWSEEFVNKNADGSLTKGGHWAGGIAYITCAQKALELARRPQNLVAVQKLSGADSYFIDTTYAAGLYECFDKAHPMTKLDDLKWKQGISDYAREVFGSFGSECGREWAIPHADFFEGLTGVSGGYFHNKELLQKLGADVVPLFELVYRDCIQMYGKYGYDPAQAAEYVLHHIAIGRPLNYHNIPAHLYWKSAAKAERDGVAVRPSIEAFKSAAPRRFSISYKWTVEQTPAVNWNVFVHFTDAAGNIKFQNDHQPALASSQWPPGEHKEGPFTVAVPDGLNGTFDIRIGLFEPPLGQRAPLPGARDGERRVLVGRIKVAADQLSFEPVKDASAATVGDLAVFSRADNGWAQGMHPLDRFVKNTHEILSPLNEITSQFPMTRHEFLTPDRRVQRTVFGEGASAVEVVVNLGATERRHQSKLGGEVLLPAYGFLVEGPTFVAFHARAWNGLRYDSPALFTLRSLDGQPLAQAKQVRVFHALGDARLKLGNTVKTVPREERVSR